MIPMQLRLCPSSEPASDHAVVAAALPRIGELLDRDARTWMVVDVHWYSSSELIDGVGRPGGIYPLVICHSLDRPVARRPPRV